MKTPRTDEPTMRLVPQNDWSTAGVVVERGVGRIYVARLGQIGRKYGGAPACATCGNRVTENDRGHSLTIALAATTAN
jgi:hypothetical protein